MGSFLFFFYVFYILSTDQSVWGSDAMDKGVAAVCQALEKNTTLQSLNLSGECEIAQRMQNHFLSVSEKWRCIVLF
jgi:hypothetical protein